MPTNNARKHVIPLGGEASFTREVIYEQFGLSINDVVPVATIIDRAQTVAALTAEGAGPTPTRPLLVMRKDARGLHALEYTYDGSLFLPVSGVLTFDSKTNADSFAVSYGSLLTVGDRCTIGAIEYRWDGTTWAVQQPGEWKNVGVFGAGFNPYSSSGWAGVKTCVQGGVVYLNGAAINSNPWSAGVAMCNVTAGIRPPFNIQGVNCQVASNGDVFATSSGSGAVSFSASWPLLP